MISVVSGLPRSGTSLTMQMLAGGRRKTDEDNPRGYFERELINKLRP